MSAWFAVEPWLIGAFALALLIVVIGIARHARRLRVVLLLLQLPCAGLLLATLLLRDAPVDGSLLVVGADAQLPDRSQLPAGVPIVTLPAARVEADAPLDVARVADLASALRRHPDIEHLHLIGDRLGPADREAIGRRALSLQPPDDAAASAGAAAAIVALDSPGTANAGSAWQLNGRIRGDAAQLQLQLLDPANQLIDSAAPDSDGRFVLRAIARAAGPTLYSIELRSADRLLQSLPLPIVATEPPPMRALVLAAVPSAETKYLRRWASDAGVQLDSRIALAPSLVQGDAPRIDAVLLAQLDLLIVDERSWPTLRAQRDELRSAIADGLGLLLRVTGPLSDAVLTDWRALGLPLQVTDGDPRTLYPDDGFDNADREPLHAWPLRAESSQVVPIWRDTDGNALAVRQSTGQGRVGAVWLSDSHALSTRGERERHASLWAQLFAELARARAAPAARLPAQPVVGRRATVCANAPALRVLTSDAQSIALPLLPGESIDERCAAFWPRTPGWHRLQSPEDEAAPENTVDAPFYVHDTDALDSLVAEADREATRQLVNRTEPPSARSTDREDWRRLAVLAWLVLMVVSWWMERRAQRAQ